MFNRSKTLVSKAKALAKKKKQAQDFLSNPKNLKLFQQVAPSQLQDSMPCVRELLPLSAD